MMAVIIHIYILTSPVHKPHKKRTRYFVVTSPELYPGIKASGPRRGIFTAIG